MILNICEFLLKFLDVLFFRHCRFPLFFFDKQPLQLAGVRPSGQDSAFRQTLVAELASTAETWSIGCDIKGGFTLLLISFYLSI